jgi:hypothetical protein
MATTIQITLTFERQRKAAAYQAAWRLQQI